MPLTFVGGTSYTPIKYATMHYYRADFTGLYVLTLF